MKPRVYVSRNIPSPGIELLSECCEVTLNKEEHPPSRENLLQNLVGKDGLLCLLTDKIDKDLMDAAPTLKVISSMSVGVDHIDVIEATRRGIYVGYTPGVLTEATADFTFALLLAAARRIVEADNYVRSGEWKISWSPTMMMGQSVWGKTLGILGLGRIGSAMALRASGFKMRVLYYDVIRASLEKEKELGVEARSLDQLLGESDFVSVNLPLNTSTYHLIDREKLRLMKPTAILINTARGPIVDEEALAEALESRVIAGAGLDVFAKEPLEISNPLRKLKNVTIAPHISSSTTESRSRMAELSARNLIAVLKGEEPPNLYNPDVKKVRPLRDTKMIQK